MPAPCYRFSDLTVSSDQPLPELFQVVDAAATAAPEVHVRWLPAAAPDLRPTFAAWLTPSGDEWLTFAECGDGFLLTFAEHSQFHVSGDAARVAAHPAPGTPPETTRHLLLNQVLPLVLSRRGRLVLHASAISWHGQVAAFLGRSGAGKSTLAAACAAAGAAVVTDDCLVVRRDSDATWRAVPCDAGMRLWPQTLELLGWPRATGAGMAHYTDKRRVGAAHAPVRFETDVLPLTRICCLSRPAEPIAPGALRGQRAVMALASELFRLDVRDAQESRWQFDAISALAVELPVDALAREHPVAAASAVLCRM